MTTTTIYCGWSGYNDPADERKFNKKIIRKLQKQGYDVALEGNGCTLSIICNIAESQAVSIMATELQMGL